MSAIEQHRGVLLDIYRAALAAVNGRTRVRAWLAAHPIAGSVHLIAVGKAAVNMALGAGDALGSQIADGLVVTRHGYGEPLPWPVIEAGHPVPDADSLRAGERLAEFVSGLPRRETVLVLLSGGASALVERLAPGASLEDLQALNRWLLSAGVPIDVCNRMRKRVSMIKAGRLAALLAPRPVLCLAISDVPGDDLRTIGSGLLAAHEPEHLRLDDVGLPGELWRRLRPTGPPPGPEDPCFDGVRSVIVARSEDARDAAARAARAAGYDAVARDEPLSGDAVGLGRSLGTRTCRLPAGRLEIWGGETTVRLPESPGRGGRCQSLALAAADALRDCGNAGLLLAAGTDGADGPGEDAGALVDGGTVDRGRAAGLEVEPCLERADAGRFLAASGDLIATGPTGTNVMDLVFGLRVDVRSATSGPVGRAG